MKLVAFKVSGFRSLAEIGEIPVCAPTVLTGANDGGKTASLDALGYLLGDYELTDQDPTKLPLDAGEATPGEDGSDREDQRPVEVVDETAVTGVFELSDGEREQCGIPDIQVRIRRVRREDEFDAYELFATVPEDPRLRGLVDRNTNELRDRAHELDVEPTGDGRQRDSWFEPLQAMAAEASTTQTWLPAPEALVERLPQYVRFSSTDEPDLKAEIQAALRGVFRKLLDDSELVTPVRDTERELQLRLREAAEDLCGHIQRRCPDLAEVRTTPEVSFREAFRGVEVHAGTAAGPEVPVDYSGSGRQRRMTLAVWEWTQDLLTLEDRQLIVAYDEPDTHLDYARQRKLVELIRQQSERDKTGVVVATHSLNLIDKVDIADVVHLELTEGTSRVNRLLTDEHDEVNRHLATISETMGLRNSVLLHERLFVAVEGSTEAQALPVLFQVATGTKLQSVGIALVVGNGNEGALKVTRWLVDHNRQVQFIIDSDSTARDTGNLFTPDKLKAYGLSEDQMHLVGDPDELEDLFTDEQWAETANAAWPRTDGRAWRPRDIAQLRADGKFSKKLHETVRRNSEDGPGSKTTCMVELAMRLTQSEEIPQQLRDVFDKLIWAAS